MLNKSDTNQGNSVRATILGTIHTLPPVRIHNLKKKYHIGNSTRWLVPGKCVHRSSSLACNEGVNKCCRTTQFTQNKFHFPLIFWGNFILGYFSTWRKSKVPAGALNWTPATFLLEKHLYTTSLSHVLKKKCPNKYNTLTLLPLFEKHASCPVTCQKTNLVTTTSRKQKKLSLNNLCCVQCNVFKNNGKSMIY